VERRNNYINPYIIKNNDRVVSYFWRDFKKLKRDDTKREKRRLFIKKLKSSKKFRHKYRLSQK